jgi:hypothetical protein
VASVKKSKNENIEHATRNRELKREIYKNADQQREAHNAQPGVSSKSNKAMIDIAIIEVFS